MSQNAIISENISGGRILHLQQGKANALQSDFLRSFKAELAAARGDGDGLILTSSGSIFSAGLDLPALLQLDRSGMEEMLNHLCDLLLAIFSHPQPVIAAINGHAIAGGAMLSVACDRRYMAQGNGMWGLNEIQLGLPFPGFCIELLRYAFSRSLLEKLIYGGVAYPAYKALDMGALDDLVEADRLMAVAVEQLEEWSSSAAAFADIKLRLHGPTVVAMEASRDQNTDWLDLWFSAEAQERIQTMLRELQNRREGGRG